MEKPDTQPDLTARIDEQLAATGGHTPGEWVTFYKHKYREHHVSVPIHGSGMMLGLFPDGVPSERPEQDAALIASAPTLRALLVEARAQLAAQAEALAKARGEVRELDLAVTAFYVCTSDRSQSNGFKALLNRIARIKKTLWPTLGAQS